MIKIASTLLREIYDHTEASYPNECCGLLIGTTDGETRIVHRFRKCTNLNTERARDRYQIDPKEWLRIQREFEDGPWEINGVYHSHPDHPSRPSKTDTDAAHAGYSYLIISVRNGKVASANSWVLSEESREFREESLAAVQGEMK